MNKVACLLAGVMVFCLAPLACAGIYSGGDGSSNDPYRISSLANWQELTNTSADWDEQFILTADLDLAGQIYTQAPIAPDTNNAGSGFQGTSFAGSFDGCGHTIHNLTIQSTGDFIGLFGQIAPTGRVINLNLRNIQIHGRGKAGGIAGDVWWGTVKNCSVGGTVIADWSAGGIVGVNDGNSNGGGRILYCFADCQVQANTYSAGGLVGDNMGTILACHAAGRIHAVLADAGGLVGFDGGDNDISQCYSTGVVTAPKDVGGLIGRTYGNGWACFWDTETSGLTASAGSEEGRTTAELKTLSTFIDYGWDFQDESVNGVEDFWRMCIDGIDYPRLYWEAGHPTDLACPDGVDMLDFAAFASRWDIQECGSETPCGPADLNDDGTVNLADLALFAADWLNGI